MNRAMPLTVIRSRYRARANSIPQRSDRRSAVEPAVPTPRTAEIDAASRSAHASTIKAFLAANQSDREEPMKAAAPVRSMATHVFASFLLGAGALADRFEAKGAIGPLRERHGIYRYGGTIRNVSVVGEQAAATSARATMTRGVRQLGADSDHLPPLSNRCPTRPLLYRPPNQHGKRRPGDHGLLKLEPGLREQRRELRQGSLAPASHN
jgi:hypothetical protein